MRHPKWLLLLINFYYLPMLYGQEFLQRHYTTENGLPSNTVYRIEQDKEGYIWIGNEFGVSRYNGKTFENFSMRDGLSDNEIVYIKCDSKGRVWFMGYNGTVSYFYQNKFYNESSDTILKQIKTTYCFLDVFEDIKQRLWFISISNSKLLDGNKVIHQAEKKIPRCSFLVEGKERQVLISFEQNRHSIFQKNQFHPLTLKHPRRLGAAYTHLPDKSILFSSTDGLVSQKDTIQNLILKYPPEINKSRYISLALTSDSVIWIAAQHGLYSFNYFTDKTLKKVLGSNSTFCNLLADKDDNLWIGSLDNGILMMPALTRKHKTFAFPNSFNNRNCYALAKSSDGNILASLGNNHIYEFNSRTGKLVNFKNIEINNDKIDYIVTDKNQSWIIANNQILHVNQDYKKSHFVVFNSTSKKLTNTNSIKGISVGNNTLYVATNYEILQYPLGAEGKQQKTRGEEFENTCEATPLLVNLNRCNSIYFDHNHTLWYGTLDGIFNYKNKKTERYSQPKSRINAIYFTRDSFLLAGTHGSGIYIYKNKKLLYHLTQENGLANNVCKKILYHKKQFFIATPSGISIFSIENNQPGPFLNLNKTNLLPSNVINDFFIDEGNLVIATTNGVVILNNENIKKIGEPQITLNLQASQSEEGTWKFRFDGLFYLNEEAVNYRYRINPSREWTYTNNNLIELPFLFAGNYLFEVQARVYNGPFVAHKQYAFVIQPPFWQKWWFIVLCSFGITLVLYLFIKNRIHHFKEKQNEKVRVRTQMMDLEQQALLTMMNPHFIFNVMNSIQHFINQNNAQLANQYLSDFAKLIRMNLTVSSKKNIQLDEEIEYLELYLSFEKLRFGERLNYQILLEPTIDPEEILVPAMMIQPFLENAIWHGILPMQTSGEVILSIRKLTEHLLEIQISDNGVGIPDKLLGSAQEDKFETGRGLWLTIKRLALLSSAIDTPMRLSFMHQSPDETEKGTTVKFGLPIR